MKRYVFSILMAASIIAAICPIVLSAISGTTTVYKIIGGQAPLLQNKHDSNLSITATYTEMSSNTYSRMDSEVIFTSTGKIFAPVITVASGAKVQWCFSDGTIINSAQPIKDYGREATRQNRLLITPWSALIRVNLGYDGSDDGSNLIKHVSPQSVVKVENMRLMAPYLQQWCSSYNQIPSLVFDDFVNLNTIECFNATGLTSLSLRNTPALRRVCIEGCSLSDLDVSGSPRLEDLRSALEQKLTGIKFGIVGKTIWHLCIRDNPQFKQALPIRQFPALKELFIWNSNQSGLFSNVSHELTNVQIYNNKYTSADFSNNPNLSILDCSKNLMTSLILLNCRKLKTINCSHNHLIKLDLSQCPALTYINANHNLLTQKAIDNILAALVKARNSGGTCILTRNSSPSRAGLKSRDILLSRGWTVDVSTTLSNIKWYLYDIMVDPE